MQQMTVRQAQDKNDKNRQVKTINMESNPMPYINKRVQVRVESAASNIEANNDKGPLVLNQTVITAVIKKPEDKKQAYNKGQD